MGPSIDREFCRRRYIHMIIGIQWMQADKKILEFTHRLHLVDPLNWPSKELLLRFIFWIRSMSSNRGLCIGSLEKHV